MGFQAGGEAVYRQRVALAKIVDQLVAGALDLGQGCGHACGGVEQNLAREGYDSQLTATEMRAKLTQPA